MTKFFPFLICVGLSAQAFLDPGLLRKPATDSWPTYHGDYSGRHYSTLKQINDTNVNHLTLAWVYRLNLSTAGANIGGEGPNDTPAGASGFGGPTVKSIPLQINGILYFSSPDH